MVVWKRVLTSLILGWNRVLFEGTTSFSLAAARAPSRAFSQASLRPRNRFVTCINRALIQNAIWATYSFVLRMIGPLRARDSLSGRWHGKGVHVDSIVVANGLSLIRLSDFTSTGYFSFFSRQQKKLFILLSFFCLVHLSDRKRRTMPVRKEGMCSFPAKLALCVSCRLCYTRLKNITVYLWLL